MARPLLHTRTQPLSVYLIIDGDQTLICRHTIKKYDITNDTGKDKWTTYKFTRNLYNIYGFIHVRRLRSAVDQLADPLFDYQSQQSSVEVLSQPDEEDNAPDFLQSAPLFRTSQPLFKKSRSFLVRFAEADNGAE
jgi:hypothetical protein